MVHKKILVIGYGNTTRSDDGAGVRVAEILAEENLAGVEVRTMQQLHVDLVEELGGFDMIVLVDASEISEDVRLEKVEAKQSVDVHSSHHLGPATLAALSEQLFQKKLNLYVCQVEAENFDFGDTLSPRTQVCVNEAVILIMKAIEEFQYA